MTQPIRLTIWLEAVIHWVELTAHGFIRLSMLTGLSAFFIFAMPVVIGLNLLTKLISTTADLDWSDR